MRGLTIEFEGVALPRREEDEVCLGIMIGGTRVGGGRECKFVDLFPIFA